MESKESIEKELEKPSPSLEIYDELTNIKECSTCLPNRFEDYVNWGIKKADKIINLEYRKIRNRNRICPACKTIFRNENTFPHLGSLHHPCSGKEGVNSLAKLRATIYEYDYFPDFETILVLRDNFVKTTLKTAVSEEWSKTKTIV